MNEEEFNKQLYLLQRYQEQAEEIYGEVEIIERLIEDYNRAIDTMQEMINAASKETLFPVGGGVFAYGEIKDVSKVLVNIGRGIFVEKPINAAIDTINKKIDDLKKSQERLLKTAEDIRTKMEEITEKIREGNVQVSEKKD
jgi:prefoldin alpha subunit